MRSIEIAGRKVGPGCPCFIIAEAGVNHNGDVALAKRLVTVAAAAGADAVKFQTFKADGVVSTTAPKAEYQLVTTDASESQLEMLRRLELSPAAHLEIQAFCEDTGILFISTPFDQGSADLLSDLGVPAFKIGSGELTSLPFLEYVARKGKPMIVSTGMSYLSEVDEAVRAVRGAGCDQLVLLHCVSNYPAEIIDANLRAMQTMAAAFDVPVGYSDHTLGIDATLAAAALGACVIEKHFTLDRSLSGPDHRASLEPDELRGMVAGIRNVERAVGTGVKAPAASEANTRQVARRSLAALEPLEEGTILSADMVTSLRPGTGISPAMLRHVEGRRLKRRMKPSELITWNDLA